MSVEDLGFAAMARSAPDAPVVRGAALAVASTLLGFGSLRSFGVSPMAAVAGGAMLGAVGAKVGSQRSSRDSTSGVEWSNIKVSMSLTEAVVIPITGGLALAMSDDPKLRTDGIGLVAIGAVGAAITYLAIQEKPK